MTDGGALGWPMKIIVTYEKDSLVLRLLRAAGLVPSEAHIISDDDWRAQLGRVSLACFLVLSEVSVFYGTQNGCFLCINSFTTLRCT